MQKRRSRFIAGLYSHAALVVAAASILWSGVISPLFAEPATNATTATYDKPIKTVDAGAYKVTIVILRRIPNEIPDSALLHDRVTEVYQIITGAGTFETGGALVDGKPVDLTSEAAGPSIRGTIQGGESRRMGPGDVVVIPPGVPHRFSKLEGTITYLVTRIEAPRP
jgi:mannose-6-phosphate isomerase-like protein (cupin superfamily)